MSIVVTGDIDWTGALVLFLEALDGGPAADTDGYAFTSSGDIEYSCTVVDELLGTYRCVAETASGVIAGVGYITVAETTTAVRIRSEELVSIDDSAFDTILTAIEGITGEQLAAITVESGTIGNFPSTLTVGDSYDTDTGWIKILITDDAGEPITGLGDLLFSNADVSFTAFRPNDSARITGNCEFVDDVTETYVKLTLTSEETNKGLPEYTYEGRLKFVWDSTSTSSDLVDSRQKTYKTTPFKFIANP